jgi:hypothetical protein
VIGRRHGKRCELLHRRTTLHFAVMHGVHTLQLAPGRLPTGDYTVMLTATDALGRTSRAVRVRLIVAAR